MATLVEGDERAPPLVGASWGVGHTAPIAAVGLAPVLLGVRFPAPVLAGAVGLVVGARLLAGVAGVGLP